VRTGLLASQVSHENGTFRVTMAAGEVLTAAGLLVAAGRRVTGRMLGSALSASTRTRPLSELTSGSGSAGVWAVGDIVGHGAFTPHVGVHPLASSYADILGQGAPRRRVPPRCRVVDVHRSRDRLGRHHEAAGSRTGLDVRTGLSQIPSSARGWIHKVGNEGFIKLVLDPSRGILVGATSVGPVGGEVLSMLTL